MLNVLYKSAIRSRPHKYTDTRITMFTYYQAENSTAEPALVMPLSKAFGQSTVLSLKMTFHGADQMGGSF